MPEELQKDPLTRGQFLYMGAVGTMMGLALTVPPAFFIMDPALKATIFNRSDIPHVWREIGSIFEVPSDEATAFRVTFPQKQTYDSGGPNSRVGSLTETALASWHDGKIPDLVKKRSEGATFSKSEVRTLEKNINVMSNACTHMGCPVRWDSVHHQIVCPCHGGIYTINGMHVGGPPPHGLWRYVFRIREDGIIEVRHKWVQGTPWIV